MTAESLRGFRVVPLSLDELRDAMSVRIMVETQALRAAIRNDDDAWATGIVSSLYALNVQAGRTGPEADIWTLEARHYAFHRALLAACKLPWTLEFASTASTRRRIPFGRLAPGRPRRASRTQRPKKNWLNLLDDFKPQRIQHKLYRSEQRRRRLYPVMAYRGCRLWRICKRMKGRVVSNTVSPRSTDNADLDRLEGEARLAEARAKLLTAEHVTQDGNKKTWWKDGQLNLLIIGGIVTIMGNLGVAAYNGYETRFEDRLKAVMILDLLQTRATN